MFLTVCGTVFADTVMVILPQVKAEVLACLSPASPFLGWDRINISCVCVCVCVHRFLCVCVWGGGGGGLMILAHIETCLHSKLAEWTFWNVLQCREYHTCTLSLRIKLLCL